MSITISLKSQNIERDVVIPVEWEDISVQYWGELSSIIRRHYEDASDGVSSADEKTHELLKEGMLSSLNQNTELNPSQTLNMNADIFSYITGLTREEVNLVDVDVITRVIECINKLTEEYKPKGKTSFDFDGETYNFPSEFFRKETYGDFIESTQLDMYIKDMDNGRYDILPEQMAILCRRVGEDYDEGLIPEKADKFRKLTMDIIWEFSFFLTHQSEKLTKLFHIYSENQQQLQEEL
tara:strand:+ start:28 stop:741 length:714 start_codon:yes stop_codon:yes gene_type:complete